MAGVGGQVDQVRNQAGPKAGLVGGGHLGVDVLDLFTYCKIKE